MKLIVGINTISIDKRDILNSGEYNIHEIEFAFDEAYNGLVKKAVFSDDLHTYQVSIVEDKCQMPYEILEKEQNINIGVYAYEVSGDDLVLRYSPKPLTTYVNKGSYKEHYDNWEEITPTDKEQIEQMVANINIDGSKSGSITTITITYKDGTTKQLTLEDGKSIEYNWEGTYLGIRQEGESEYQYVNLKGDKGEAGAIQMLIVNELPTIGNKDTIYLVPNNDPQTSNYYDEYIYINNAWEKLGGVQVQVDLTDYVKNTDYATSSKGGVVKIDQNYGLRVSNGTLVGYGVNYTDYQNALNQLVVDKGTLENVITGKGLVSNTDYASSSIGGVIKTAPNDYASSISNGYLLSQTKTYAQYGSANDNMFVSKGTLENVITGKQLVDKTYVDNNSGSLVVLTDEGKNSSSPFVFDGKKKGTYVFNMTRGAFTVYFYYKPTSSDTNKSFSYQVIKINLLEDIDYNSMEINHVFGKMEGIDLTTGVYWLVDLKKTSNGIETGTTNGLYTILTEKMQTIYGTKTFNYIPQQANTTAPTLDTEFTNKKYVDDNFAKIPTLTGTSANPIQLVDLDEGYYLLNGYYTDGEETYGYEGSKLYVEVSIYTEGEYQDKNIESLLGLWTFYKEDAQSNWELDYHDTFASNTDMTMQLNGKSPKLAILSYGSSTWNDFINAYNNNAIVYCRASSNNNPATGSQTRMAFMAYVSNATSPTSVEFQYYRSVSSHSDSQQGDQVFVYKLTNASGGTWTVETREASSKVVAGTGLSSSYSNGAITLSADTSTLATKTYVDNAIGTALGGSY